MLTTENTTEAPESSGVWDSETRVSRVLEKEVSRTKAQTAVCRRTATVGLHFRHCLMIYTFSPLTPAALEGTATFLCYTMVSLLLCVAFRLTSDLVDGSDQLGKRCELFLSPLEAREQHSQSPAVEVLTCIRTSLKPFTINDLISSNPIYFLNSRLKQQRQRKGVSCCNINNNTVRCTKIQRPPASSCTPYHHTSIRKYNQQLETTNATPVYPIRWPSTIFSAFSWPANVGEYPTFATHFQGPPPLPEAGSSFFSETSSRAAQPKYTPGPNTKPTSNINCHTVVSMFAHQRWSFVSATGFAPFCISSGHILKMSG